MTQQQKLDVIQRNFIRMCQACKLETAFIVFHLDNHYHGTMIYSSGAENPCKIVLRIAHAIDETLKGLPGVIQLTPDSLS